MMNGLYGLIICFFTALLAIFLSKYVGITLFGFEKSPFSPIIFSIFIGLLLNNSFKELYNFNDGFKFCIKYILKAGIILLGIRLSLFDFYLYGAKSLSVIIPCIICTILIVRYLKSFFRVSENLAQLIAVGTSICGATAIVALAPSINAKKTEITYAVANITIFGIFAMFTYPFLGNFLFSGDDTSIGIFLGSSIHETAQVAGSGMIYAEQYFRPDVIGIATLTKLVRNTLMVIVIPLLAHRALSKSQSNVKISSIFPYFILGFIAFGLLRTFGDYYFYSLNNSGSLEWKIFVDSVKNLAEFLLIIAMSAVGYNTNFRYFKDLGIRPFYLGFIAASVVGIVSTVIIKALIL